MLKKEIKNKDKNFEFLETFGAVIYNGAVEKAKCSLTWEINSEFINLQLISHYGPFRERNRGKHS